MLKETLQGILAESGFAALQWQNVVMFIVSFILIYLAIKKEYEPLLLLPIAFGMLLRNLPLTGLMDVADPWQSSGVLAIMYNGSAAQFGIYVAFLVAIKLGFTGPEAASIGIIGGADGPTAIFTTSQLAPHLLAPIAVAAYSYMALIPMIQPPIMKALTTEKERTTVMSSLRKVSKLEKVIFPIVVVTFTSLLLPDVAPLLGMLMLGNLFKESGVVNRLSDTAQNALMNIVTIMLGTTVGATADGTTFLQLSTLKIIALGLIAFCFATAAGVLFGKILYAATGGKINPLIGSAGVSAVPMAARVSQVEGRKYNSTNFLLMHAMGPNVAGVIGSAVAAGVFLILFGH